MKIALLDCTLRDGGYLVDKNWNEIDIQAIIGGLTNAGVDYVELGFLQNESNGESVVFQNSRDARKYIPNKRKNTTYTVFADYSRYDPHNLDEYDGQSFECVRVCFAKEERKEVMEMARIILDKGYKVFLQPVGILRYSHHELLDLIDDINVVRPHCMGIVDTFGSVYEEDLDDIFSFINSTLDKTIMLDFHSHNNQQLSNGLSQHFFKIARDKRSVIVDTTLFGMGRGVGNCPTELIVQYLNVKRQKHYNLDIILDLIDIHIMPIKEQVNWDYNTSMFLAGTFGAHVNNVNYLQEKAGVRSQDMRYILNRLTDEECAKYLYARLDELYTERFSSSINDREDFIGLKNVIANKRVLIVAPGKTATECSEEIKQFIAEKKTIVISINFSPLLFDIDYIYFNNARRYDYWKNDKQFSEKKSIITSNIADTNENGFVISFMRLMKSGWNNFDNSTILLLRLADMLEASEIALAGFDGFSLFGDDYATSTLEKSKNSREMTEKNRLIESEFVRFMQNRKVVKIYFITPSKFDKVSGLTIYERGYNNV